MTFDATPSKLRPLKPTLDELALTRRSPVGKIVLFVLLACVVAGGGFFAWHTIQAGAQRETKLRGDLAAALQKGLLAEGRETATKTTLATREAELATLRTLEAEVRPSRLGPEQAATLLAKLREAIGISGVTSSERGRVTLVLGEAALFDAGKSELTDAGEEVLGRLGKALEAFPDTQLWVHAHTGERRPRDKRAFPSNWELSTARALAVVHYLQDEAHVDGDRLAVVGLSQYRPRVDRGTSARVEIAVFPKDPAPATAAPGATAAPSAARRAPPRRPPRPEHHDSGLGSL
jgi:flagellar motor protein MotB